MYVCIYIHTYVIYAIVYACIARVYEWADAFTVSIHVCVHIYTYLCDLCNCVCLYARVYEWADAFTVRIHVCVYMYVCDGVCNCVCLYARVYAFTPTNIHMRIQHISTILTGSVLRERTYVHTYVHTYMHTYILFKHCGACVCISYIYIYIYTYTCRLIQWYNPDWPNFVWERKHTHAYIHT
jgi:hypothetical protein